MMSYTSCYGTLGKRVSGEGTRGPWQVRGASMLQAKRRGDSPSLRICHVPRGDLSSAPLKLATLLGSSISLSKATSPKKSSLISTETDALPLWVYNVMSFPAPVSLLPT